MPNSLTPVQGEEIASSLGFQNVHRMNGPANSIGFNPGIYPGVEFLLFFPPDLEKMGIANNGQIPLFMPVPRLFITKGLPYHVDLNFHFLPEHVMPAYHGWGVNAKWTIFPEKVSFAALALKLSFDHAKYILNSMGTTNFASDFIISQDLVDFLPYAGLGLINVSSFVDKAFTASGVEEEFSSVGFHLFGGVQIKTPITFNIEVGLSNKYAYAGVSVGKNLFDRTPEDQMQ